MRNRKSKLLHNSLDNLLGKILAAGRTKIAIAAVVAILVCPAYALALTSNPKVALEEGIEIENDILRKTEKGAEGEAEVDSISLVVKDHPLLRPVMKSVSVVKMSEDEDTMPVTDRNWWHLLRKGELNLRDTTVEYPRFVKFCRDVYLWGDKTFNTYDTTYVVGTGTNWKARVAFDGWSDSYHMNLDRKMPITLFSTPYMSAGIFLHFMAVSVNQTIDLSNLCFNKPVNHHKFEFGFNCARFNLDLAFNSNTGGSDIRSFGDYKKGHFFKQYFSGVNLHSFNANLYYYFNNYKYANGAAYYFSKIQKISAGSFILGFTYGYEDIELDFTKLPEFLIPYMKVDPRDYKFNYYNYCLLFGYGFNWVLGKHFLYNVTAMPSIGVLHCTEESEDKSAKLLSLNANWRMSLTYNKDNFFTCFIVKVDGHWYKTSRLSVFNAIENASLSVGVRF